MYQLKLIFNICNDVCMCVGLCTAGQCLCWREEATEFSGAGITRCSLAPDVGSEAKFRFPGKAA